MQMHPHVALTPQQNACRAYDDVPRAEDTLEQIVREIEAEADITDDMINEMLAMQIDMASRIAYFRDGVGFGKIGPETLAAMRHLEERLCVLLEAVLDDEDFDA